MEYVVGKPQNPQEFEKDNLSSAPERRAQASAAHASIPDDFDDNVFFDARIDLRTELGCANAAVEPWASLTFWE
jgi:hypothetical protein